MKITPITPIKPSNNIHPPIQHDRRMRVPGTWTVLNGYILPCVGGKIEGMEVGDTGRTVETTEYIHLRIYHAAYVPVSGAGGGGDLVDCGPG